MADIQSITRYGSQLFVDFTDGTRQIADRTVTDIWYVSGAGSNPGPNPNPDPDPLTITNCNNESVRIEGTRLKWAVGIYAGAQKLNLSDTLKRRAGIAALMTALVESVLLMYANSNVPESLNFQYDAIGSDHDSLGLMQQRPSAGWGSIANLMNAEYNARAFFGGPDGPNNGNPPGLLDKSGWETGDLGAWCQAVQVSGFPDRYQCWEAGATQLYDHIAGSTPNPSGAFRWPFKKSTISSEYGPRSGGTGSFHEGTDFAGGLVGGTGTAIPCIGDGVVQEKRYHANFGNMVIVNHGILEGGTYAGKRCRSLYAHMNSAGPTTVGRSISKGSTVGPIGNTGASYGAHLHLEIHISEPDAGIVWNTSNDGGFRTAVNPRTFLDEYSV